MSLLEVFLSNKSEQKLNIWAWADPHLPGSLNDKGYDSLGVPISQIEADNSFDYDVVFGFGDLLHSGYEDAVSGDLVKSKLETLSKGRHYAYTIGGNHDSNTISEPNGANWVYQQYIDPIGAYTGTSGVSNASRPYPVIGTYERYYIEIGNILCVFIGDRNDGPPEGGRDGTGTTKASGMVTSDTVRFWLDLILKYPDRPIIVSTHHPLKDTNFGSRFQDSWRAKITNSVDAGDDEIDRATYIAYIDNVLNETIFQDHLAQNTGIVDLWMAGHTHHYFLEEFEGLGELALKFGTNFLQVANLNKDYYHPPDLHDSMSKHLSLSGNKINVRTYIHNSPNGLNVGFQPSGKYQLNMKGSYSASYTPVTIAAPSSNVSSIVIDNSTTEQLDLSWINENTGVLIVRKSGSYPTFTPSDETTYLIGDTVGDGEVAFIGINESFSDIDLITGVVYYYNFYSFNSAGGSIKYKTVPIQSNKVVI